MEAHVSIMRSVPVSEIFPGLDNDFGTFRRLVSRLSRTDTLFWCARLNLILSSAENDDEISKQQHFLYQFLTSDEITRVNEFCKRLNPKELSARILARGQILEMIRWVSLFCSDAPNDIYTLGDPDIRRTFAQALLIAGDLWAARVCGDKLSYAIDNFKENDQAKSWAMPSLRLNISDNTSAMDLWRIIARGKMLFGTDMPIHRPAFLSEFQTQIGISLEDYYLITGFLKIQFCDIKKEQLQALLYDNKGCGIFNINAIMQQEDLPIETRNKLLTYIQHASQTPDELRQALWGTSTSADPDFERARARYDYTALRSKPMLRTDDGRVIILDPVFFSEKASIGPVFAVSNTVRSNQGSSNSIFSDFGRAFESYCGRILNSMYPSDMLSNRLSCPLLRTDNTEMSDACLNDLTEAVFFEIKGVFLSDEIIEDQNSDQYIESFHKKYVRDDKKMKGVGQLARTINRVIAKEWIAKDQDFSLLKKIYPVLLVHDKLLTSPGHTEYLAAQFAKELEADTVLQNGNMIKSGFLVLPVIVMQISDLEDLQISINYFSLRDLLSSYSQDCPDRIMPLRQYVAQSTTYNYRYNMSMYSETVQTLKTGIRQLFHVDSEAILPLPSEEERNRT